MLINISIVITSFIYHYLPLMDMKEKMQSIKVPIRLLKEIEKLKENPRETYYDVIEKAVAELSKKS